MILPHVGQRDRGHVRTVIVLYQAPFTALRQWGCGLNAERKVMFACHGMLVPVHVIIREKGSGNLSQA